ncbi:Bbp16 family capsid cement protein [Asticcacaulis sp.]|uniref:Bbp16 family capsid cement protein n=1 Tax=Asticcacaulis sp. TaxID=1872648 RepID=UPI0031D55F63
MILDERTEFCDATALNTGAAGTYLIGDVMDLGAGRDFNDIEDLYLVIGVDTAVTSGGSATVQFHLASDAQAAIATDGSATYHWSSPAIPKATLVAGYYVCKLPIPKGGAPEFERYLGILQTTGTAALTAGKVNAFLTDNPNTYRSFPDGVL